MRTSYLHQQRLAEAVKKLYMLGHRTYGSAYEPDLKESMAFGGQMMAPLNNAQNAQNAQIQARAKQALTQQPHVVGDTRGVMMTMPTSEDISRHENAEAASIGGYDTHNGLQQRSVDAGNMAHDLEMGRQMMQQGGMMNSLSRLQPGNF